MTQQHNRPRASCRVPWWKTGLDCRLTAADAG